MAHLAGQAFGEQLKTILGIDRMKSVKICFARNEVVTAEVEVYVTDTQAQLVMDLLEADPPKTFLVENKKPSLWQRIKAKWNS